MADADDLDRLNRRRRLEEELAEVWGKLETLAPEYVSLRRGDPINWLEIKERCFDFDRT